MISMYADAFMVHFMQENLRKKTAFDDIAFADEDEDELPSPKQTIQVSSSACFFQVQGFAIVLTLLTVDD